MEENHEHYDGQGLKGALWTIAGTAIAGVAQRLVNGHVGAFGYGGVGYGGGNVVAEAANTGFALELARKDAEIALLKANADTDKKLVEVYANLRVQDKEQDAKIAALNEKYHCLDKRISEAAIFSTNGITHLNDSVAALARTVCGITRTVVPITSVCPQPMPQYNSWTAPTTVTGEQEANA
ncbi:MAG: hypothetical protein MJZ81_07590 [Bacteroidales bacterium]|nr:hypothetical protein [Bacteroidales bacterium]